MNIHYLETLTLEVPFRYIISFFSRINFQCMSSLVYTVYCQKQPSEHRCSAKNGVLKDFVNFVGKHLCWSLFLIKLQAWHLFWRASDNDCFCTALTPLIVTYPFYFIFSTFLIITTTTVNISDVCFWFKFKKASKNLNLVCHFHWSLTFIAVFFPCFFAFLSFFFIFSCRYS